MRLAFLIFFILLGCAGTENGVIKHASNDKNVFFSMTKKDGYDYLKMQGFTLRKLDSVKENVGKVYLFYYRRQAQ
ncbi:MAG: hypothetical protein HQK96_17795 [Nitrospirae bacterium]|nr:hypothetical protein [Nitrospirota bacterium]